VLPRYPEMFTVGFFSLRLEIRSYLYLLSSLCVLKYQAKTGHVEFVTGFDFLFGFLLNKYAG
jgi:hypothetical protein